MTYLLDVNVLIALVDPAHIGHDMVHNWFDRQGSRSWASCPVTENGLIRIISNPKYPNACLSPAEAVQLMMSLRALHGHEFWHDNLSFCATPDVDTERMTSHAQVTDTYLLALTVGRKAMLATLDRKLSTAAVKNGGRALHVISN